MTNPISIAQRYEQFRDGKWTTPDLTPMAFGETRYYRGPPGNHGADLMPDKIDPALSEAAWKAARVGGPLAIAPCSHVPASHRCAVCEAHAHIAIDNDSLPDDDPRKITREWIADLHQAYRDVVILARMFQDAGNDADRLRCRALAERLHDRADALESYLSPR